MKKLLNSVGVVLAVGLAWEIVGSLPLSAQVPKNYSLENNGFLQRLVSAFTTGTTSETVTVAGSPSNVVVTNGNANVTPADSLANTAGSPVAAFPFVWNGNGWDRTVGSSRWGINVAVTSGVTTGASPSSVICISGCAASTTAQSTNVVQVGGITIGASNAIPVSAFVSNDNPNGQANMAGSSPVVIASDQTAVAVTTSATKTDPVSQAAGTTWPVTVGTVTTSPVNATIPVNCVTGCGGSSTQAVSVAAGVTFPVSATGPMTVTASLLAQPTAFPVSAFVSNQNANVTATDSIVTTAGAPVTGFNLLYNGTAWDLSRGSSRWGTNVGITSSSVTLTTSSTGPMTVTSSPVNQATAFPVSAFVSNGNANITAADSVVVTAGSPVVGFNQVYNGTSYDLTRGTSRWGANVAITSQSLTTALPVSAFVSNTVNTSTAIASMIVGDPCMGQTKTSSAISIAGALSQSIVLGVAAKKIYVCAITIQVSPASVLNLIEAQSTLGVSAAVVGNGTTVTSGMFIAAGNIFSLGSGNGTVASTANNATALRVWQSAASQLGGVITYVQQ